MTLLRQREAATLLHLSERTLERFRVSGTGPKFVRLGRSIRYRLTDIEAFIAPRIVGSTSERPAA
jgi:predicted DNA-binding transcriptional regulator AlpA